MVANTPAARNTHTTEQSDRLLHRGYITAAQAAMAGLGIPVRLLRLAGTSVRHADLAIHRDKQPVPVLLRWDEINGWSLHDRGNGGLPPIFFGVTALPSPDELAAWVLLSLQHLDVSPVRTGEPFTPPDLAAQLRQYQQRHII